MVSPPDSHAAPLALLAWLIDALLTREIGRKVSVGLWERFSFFIERDKQEEKVPFQTLDAFTRT